MAKNDKASNGVNEVDMTTEVDELIPVPAEIDTILSQKTEIDPEDYEQYLAVARNLGKYKPTISISSKYYEFTKPGEAVRGVFLGITTLKKRDSAGELISLECVQWLAEDGSLYVNAGAALVSTFRQFLPPRGCPIEITFQSKKERTKLYDVRVLA